MQIAASIFKAYDIRGIVPSTINEEAAEALGKAFGTTALALGEKTVAVGFCLDARPCSGGRECD
jgi:phosphomannomutase